MRKPIVLPILIWLLGATAGGAAGYQLAADAVSPVAGVGASASQSVLTIGGSPIAGWSLSATFEEFAGLPFPIATIPAGLDGPSGSLPRFTDLNQNAPNPFNPMTRIRFQVAQDDGGVTPTRLEIFDVAGRSVKVLVDEPMGPGSYERVWNGLDSRGHSAPTGIFFARLQSGTTTKTIRMVLSK